MTNPAPEKSSIVLVDDHPIVRDHLRQLLNYQPDLTVCAEAADADQAMQAVSEKQPALVILDLALKQSHGIDLLKDLRLHHPRVRVLVLSMHDETLWAERALRAGAAGYIMKEALTDQVLVAIRRILSGETYLSERMTSRILNGLSGHGSAAAMTSAPVAQLSDRELTVFQLIGVGHGRTEIARQLGVDVKTVESYRARIREKLHLCDAAELRRKAIAWVHGPGSI